MHTHTHTPRAHTMALVATSEDKKALRRALRAVQAHEEEATGRMRELCGAEIDAYEKARKALDEKLKCLDGDAKYRAATDAADHKSRQVRRCMQNAADNFYDAVDDVMRSRELDDDAKEKKVRVLTERATSELSDVVKEFPSVLRAFQLQALQSGGGGILRLR